MISNDIKFCKINNNLLFEEISRKAKCNFVSKEKTLKLPKTPYISNNQLPVSPYSNNSPSFELSGPLRLDPWVEQGEDPLLSKLKSPIIAKTPNKIATSPYYKEKCVLSPKTPRSPFAIKSPYKIESPYSIKKDPWIYNPTMNEKFTKIIGIDEYGNTCRIPTVDYQLPQSVRYIPDENDGSDDYILIGDIFLDQKNSKGRDYNFVSQNMRNISLQTNNLRLLYANKFKPFNKNIKGKVSLEEYEELLEIYENNQVYYQDCIQNETSTYDQLCIDLTELEYWFICIVEPYDYDEYDLDDYSDWKTREQFKYNKGYSGYCDPDLYFYIKQPLPQDIINYIKNSHKNLFKC